MARQKNETAMSGEAVFEGEVMGYSRNAPNNRVNLTTGSNVALVPVSSVAAAGYPWR
jgi:hypothetical protein